MRCITGCHRPPLCDVSVAGGRGLGNPSNVLYTYSPARAQRGAFRAKRSACGPAPRGRAIQRVAKLRLFIVILSSTRSLCSARFLPKKSFLAKTVLRQTYPCSYLTVTCARSEKNGDRGQEYSGVVTKTQKPRTIERVALFQSSMRAKHA